MAVKKAAKKITKKMAKTKKTVPKLRRTAMEAAIERMSEEIQRLTIQNEKTSEEVKKTSEEVKKTTKSLNESYGVISRRLGKLTELVVVPKIRQDMNAQGHDFDSAEVDTLIRGVVNGRKEDIAEVDMLLYGPEEVMAVEIKTRLRESNVMYHIDKLQDLRDYEEDADIKGKKLFGAVVGIVVDEKARELAKKYGLYVVEIREEEKKLKIDKPEQCRIW